jgi:hypothetical protein
MQVTLDIPNPKAWQALQPLVQYLAIKVVDFKGFEIKPDNATIKKNTLNEKMKLMQQAQHDALFHADIQAVTDDFKFIDQETVEII